LELEMYECIAIYNIQKYNNIIIQGNFNVKLSLQLLKYCKKIFTV